MCIQCFFTIAAISEDFPDQAGQETDIFNAISNIQIINDKKYYYIL